MEFKVLGPLVAVVDDEELPLRSTKQRILLATLLGHANAPVSQRRLMEALWEAPPASAAENLRLYVYHLRRALGDDGRITRHSSGYMIAVRPGEFDAHVFDRLLKEGAEAGDPRRASELLSEALALWRGSAYGDLADVASIRHDALRLEEARLRALEARIAADLGLGRHAELVPELTALTQEYPFRESQRGQLMRALYGTGRQAEALEVFHQTRALLAEELGVDPGPELRRLHEAMLHGEQLSPPPPEAPLIVPGPVARGEETSPYRGLTAFQVEDKEWFFGRASLVDRLLRRIERFTLVSVFGASGSGKSSLLRAGLLGRLCAESGWSAILMTPTERPLDALADQLAKVSGRDRHRVREELEEDPATLDITLRGTLVAGPEETRALLVVDQFEELFTLCGDERERGQFVEALLNTALTPHRRTTVVLGVRADFLAHLSQWPGLTEAMGDDAPLLVGPPTPADLREIVVRPALRAGMSVDADFLATVLADAGGQPGALPLLSHALLETWHNRSQGALTLSAYQASGGVRGAIAQTAEREYDGFASEERQAARQIFLRLTSLGDGTEDTRRPIGRAELDGLADPVVIAGVLDRLAEARLVVLDEETVQVAHEALIRSWPRLQRWLGDDRATLLAHRRLTEAARGWEDLGRDPGVLYRGAALATTAALAETELNEPEKEFLEASRAQESARSRALRRWVGALAVLLSLALLAGFLAVVQSREARMRERLESAHQLALTSRHLLAIDPDLSGLVAIEAYRLHPDLETRGALLSAAFAAQRRVDLNRGGTPVFDVEIASDGSLAASAGRDGAVTLWDLRRHVRAGMLSPDASTAEGLYMRKVAFSADSLLLASLATHPRGTTPGVVTVWDLRTRRPVFQERRPGLANALAFSEDGTTLAVGVGSGIELWDLRRGTRKTLNAHTQQVSTLALNASGTLLASANVSEPPVIWDVRSGKPRSRVPVKDVHTVAFDEGGDLVTGSLRHGVHFWDVAGGKAVRRSQLPGGAALTWDMSDPKGGRTAVVDENGLITVWDLHRREPITTYQDRGRAEARSVALSGTQLVSAGIGRTIVLREPAVPAFTGHFGAVTDLAVSPGDAMVATAGADRTVRLWTPDGRPAGVLEGHSDRVTAIDFSPDGSLLAALTRDHTVTLWNTATRQRVKTVRYEGWGASMDLAYHPRGTAIATAALALRWWDAPGLTRAESSLYAAGALKFSPDGLHLIATNPAGGLQVLDLATKKAVHEVITDQGEIRDVAISPDGSLIATAGADRTVKIWQSRTGLLLTTLTGHTAPIRVLAFSRDGRRLASGGEDQLVIAWEVGSWRKAAELTGHRSAVEALAFTHAGELLSGGLDGRVIRWRFSPAEAADQICREVGRDLTPGERAIYVPGGAQSPGCGAFAGQRPS